ncbi:MAG TPA: HD domain-containing phosphohydrolase [Thermoanaerobaculia bacterium]|nr:HD domain-containing phosphohydrolase [Thermoanaerobaculia bacterium]
MTTPRILVVDDVEQNCVVLSEMLTLLGYEPVCARDGFEALAKLQLGIDLVLLDVMMPGLDGYEVARRLRADPQFADLPVIMVTALDSREDRVLAVRAGASDFIAKPVDRTELEVRVGSQLKLKEAREALDRHRADLEQTVARRTADLAAALEKTVEAQRRTYEAHLDTIRRLVLAAELKDSDTARHIVRISRYTGVLARALHLPPGDVETLCLAATLHDVGKIGIPDSILVKTGALTVEERRIMETHTLIGGRILDGSPSEIMRAGRTIALTHHEKWDGSGYPHGIGGENIPLWGRICSVADVFDALTTDRPYRPALSHEAALAIMVADRASRFDAKLLDLFIANLDEVLGILADFRNAPAESASDALLARGEETVPWSRS